MGGGLPPCPGLAGSWVGCVLVARVCLSRRDLGTALSYCAVKPLRAEVVVNRGVGPVGTVPPYGNARPSGTASRETREAAKCETAPLHYSGFPIFVHVCGVRVVW